MTAAVEERWTDAADPRWQKAGVTARMLDYWTRTEVLVCEDPAPGSGRSRWWPVSELHVAARIVRLRKAGFSLEAAVPIARLGFGRHEIAPGITIQVKR